MSQESVEKKSTQLGRKIAKMNDRINEALGELDELDVSLANKFHAIFLDTGDLLKDSYSLGYLTGFSGQEPAHWGVVRVETPVTWEGDDS